MEYTVTLTMQSVPPTAWISLYVFLSYIVGVFAVRWGYRNGTFNAADKEDRTVSGFLTTFSPIWAGGFVVFSAISLLAKGIAYLGGGLFHLFGNVFDKLGCFVNLGNSPPDKEK